MLLQQEDPPTSSLPIAQSYLQALNHDAEDWLRLALRHSAHGCDLFIGTRMNMEDDALRAWWGAGWVKPLQFAPDLAQRAFGGLGCKTPKDAQICTEAYFGLKPMAYWWGPGDKAREALGLLPKPQGLAVGDRVRYSSEFLRSIGMSGSSIERWHGVITKIKALASCSLALCEGKEEETCACGSDPECSLCQGSGKTRLRRINTTNLRKIRD